MQVVSPDSLRRLDEQGRSALASNYLAHRLASRFLRRFVRDGDGIADFSEETAEELPAFLDSLAHRAAIRLKSEGCVVVRDFIPRVMASSFANEALALKNRLRPVFEARKPHEEDSLFVYFGTEREDEEVKLASKTGINFRVGADEGMLDLFNPQFHFAEAIARTGFVATRDFVIDVLERATGDKYKFDVGHMYINHNVTRTRGFHFDDSHYTAKSFLYLTDVLEPNDGPYCYALGTHRAALLRRANRAINRLTGVHWGDWNLINLRDCVYLTAPAGSLVISFQNGAHRGHPQSSGRQRVALVDSFFPQSLDTLGHLASLA